MVNHMSCPGSGHCPVSQLGADQGQLLSHERTITVSQHFWCLVFFFFFFLEYDVFVSSPSQNQYSIIIWSLSLVSSFIFSKGIWQPETVWLQTITWWRSVILGCPVRMTMVCIWQRVVSGRSPLNGRLLRPWTTVGNACRLPAPNQGYSCPVTSPMLPPAGVL